MKYSLLFSLLALGLFACAQPSASIQPVSNRQLKHELDSLLIRDQLFREVLFDPTNRKRKQRYSLATAYHLPAGQEMVGLSALMLAVDSSDLHRVRAIIGFG